MIEYVSRMKKTLENINQKANLKMQELKNQIKQLNNQIEFYGIKIGQILILIGKGSENLEYVDDSKKLDWIIELLKGSTINRLSYSHPIFRNQ